MERINFARMLLDSLLVNPSTCNVFEHEATESIGGGLPASCVIKNIPSYSSEVFLLQLKNDSGKFILKIREIPKNSPLRKLEAEISSLQVLKKNVKVPEPILYGVCNGYEVSLISCLSGHTLDKEFLNEDIILKVWNSIIKIQNNLYKNQSTVLKIPNEGRYGDKLSGYTLRFVGEMLRSEDVDEIDFHLSTGILKTTETIFSDRSPRNWLINNDGVFAIDFDLLFLETRLSDFVQFIDDPMLSTPYKRDELISKCLLFLEGNGEIFSKADFHWCAIYRNLIQAALFYKINKGTAKFFYKMALDSISFVGMSFLHLQIKKILNEVA